MQKLKKLELNSCDFCRKEVDYEECVSLSGNVGVLIGNVCFAKTKVCHHWDWTDSRQFVYNDNLVSKSVFWQQWKPMERIVRYKIQLRVGSNEEARYVF